MFSDFSFFRRAAKRRRAPLRHGRRQRQRKLRLETLEDRRLLASFSEAGSILNLELNVASEVVGIVSNSATYSLTLNAPNAWSGTDTANVTGSGSNTLTVTAAGLAAFDTINITDSNSGCAVTFNDSGLNAYSDDFTIVLDGSPAGQITFNGASGFGTSNLSASTTANIVVSTGAGVTTSGSVTITADSVDIQGTITADLGITLQPATPLRTIGLNDAAGDFNLTATELGQLSSPGTVIIGRSDSGAITIGSTAGINLSLENYGLTLRGGNVTFNRYLQLPSGKAVTFQTGAISGASAAGSGVDITAGAVILETQGAVGASGNPLWLAVDALQGTVNGNLFVRESDSLTISGALSAKANTIRLDSGTFTLGASNVLDDDSRLHVLGAVSPATLALGDFSDTVAGVTLGSALTTGNISGNAGAVLTSLSDFQLQRGTVGAKLAEPEFGAPVGLIKTTTGTVTLSNVGSTFTGPTTISAGTLSISADSCLGTPPATTSPGHLVIDGGTLAISTSLTLAATRGIKLGSPTAAGAGTISVPSGTTLTYNGIVADNGAGADGLIKKGAGTLILGESNTFSGGTTFAGPSSILEKGSGVIQIDHANALGASGTILFTDDGTLRYGLGITIDLSSRIDTGSSAVTASIDTNGNDVTFGTEMNLSGRLAKLGSGKLTFTAAGLTEVFVLYVTGGELALTSGTISVTGYTSGGVLTGISDLLTSVFLRNARLSIAGGTLTMPEALLVGKASAFSTGTSPWKLDVSSGSLHVGGDLVTTLGSEDPDPALFTIRGGTTQVDRNLVVGWDSGEKLQISDGTVTVGTATVPGNLVVGRYSPSVLDVSGGTVTAGSLRHENAGRFAEANLTGGVVTVGAVLHQTIQMTSIATDDGFIVNLDAGGTLVTDRVYLNRTVTGATHTLALRFDGGTLRKKSASADHNLIDNAEGTGGSVRLDVVIEDGGALIDINGSGNDPSADVVQPLLHDSVLDESPDGGLMKWGAGTLTLFADNTFTGPATVREGTLALENASSNNIIAKANVIDVELGTGLDVTGLDTGTLILADKQTLMGKGTVTGKLIASSGSIVAPGGGWMVAPGGGPDILIQGPGILAEIGDYIMNSGSSLNIEIGGDTAGNDNDNHDQMDVRGAVRLDGATLNVTAFKGYVPQFSDEYVIINNDGADSVTGTFAGLPEGAILPDFLGSGLSARISYVDGDGNDVVISFFGAAAIELVKAGTFQDENNDGEADVGEPIAYTFTVTNTGNVTLSNVTVSDPLAGLSAISPAGVASLAPGGVATFTATYAVTQADIDLGSVYNLATADSDQSGPATDDHTEPLPQNPRLSLDKTGVFAAGADGYAQPGELIAYTFVVNNTGNVTLSNVTVSDPLAGLSAILPAGVASLAPGGVATFTATYAVTQADIDLGSVYNLATADSDQSDPATDDNTEPLPRAPIIILGPDKNPGWPQAVRVVNSNTGLVESSFVAFEDNYVGGTRVAVADLDGNGTDEIITAPGLNHVPEVRMFTLDGKPVPGFPNFLAYGPTFTFGVQLAVADVNADGLPDIITVPSFGAADVRVFLNRHDHAAPASPAFQAAPDISFRAFPLASIGGAVVTAADMGRIVSGEFVNVPDRKAEIIVGTGGGSTTVVTVFDVAGATSTPVRTFFPFTVLDPDFLGGVALDVGRIDGDSIPDIIAGMGVNGTARIEVWTWKTSDASLSLLGAIPDAFTGPSNNAPVSVAAVDTDGNEIADAIFAVQGPIGTTREIHRFNIASTSPFGYQQAPPLTGFPGPWFIATSKAVPPADVWTNHHNPYDVNNDSLVTPLDALETVNYINNRTGTIELPAHQFSPPRFFDADASGAITPADVLLVVNYLNDPPASSGEGERSEPVGAVVAMTSPSPAPLGLALPRSVSSTPEGLGRQVVGLVPTAVVPKAEWSPSVADVKSPPVPNSTESWLDDLDLLDLDSVLEDIAPEIAAPQPAS